MAARRGGLLCLPLALALLAGGSSARGAGPLPVASSEAFDSVLGNTASCHRACQLTYSLHTYPKVRAGPASRLSRRGGPLPGLGPAPLLPPSPPREPCCGWRGRPRAWPSALFPPAAPRRVFRLLVLRSDGTPPGFSRAGAFFEACRRACVLQRCWTCL